MPQRGARGCPVTDLRNLPAPAMATAADTIATAGTSTARPSTRRLSVFDPAASPMRSILVFSIGQVGLDGNRRWTPQNLIRHQFSGGERSSDAQAFVTGGEIEARAWRRRTNQRQFI